MGVFNSKFPELNVRDVGVTEPESIGDQGLYDYIVIGGEF